MRASQSSRCVWLLGAIVGSNCAVVNISDTSTRGHHGIGSRWTRLMGPTVNKLINRRKRILSVLPAVPNLCSHMGKHCSSTALLIVWCVVLFWPFAVSFEGGVRAYTEGPGCSQPHAHDDHRWGQLLFACVIPDTFPHTELPGMPLMMHQPVTVNIWVG